MTVGFAFGTRPIKKNKKNTWHKVALNKTKNSRLCNIKGVLFFSPFCQICV